MHTYIQTYRHPDRHTYIHSRIHIRFHIYIYIYATPPPGLSTNFGGEKRVGPNGPFGGPRCGAWPPGLSTLFGLFWWK